MTADGLHCTIDRTCNRPFIWFFYPTEPGGHPTDKNSDEVILLNIVRDEVILYNCCKK